MILHYVEEGSGSPVVLLGSIASSTDMWAEQIPALAEKFRVLALDHRGHGESGLPSVEPGEASISDLATDVLATLDAAGVDRFSVVGLSLGGAIAQYLAAHTDRVTAAVFACTATAFGGPAKWKPRAELTRAEGLEPMADGVVDVWLTKEFQTSQPEVAQRARDMIVATRGEGYAQCSDALAKWDFADSLPRITCPVLTIAGEEDPSTPPETLQDLANGVGGESRSVVVPGAHVPTFESPAEFNAALLGFL